MLLVKSNTGGIIKGVRRMSCSNCYYYWNDEKYCPKRGMHMMKGDSCNYWKPNDAMSISQRMNERS